MKMSKMISRVICLILAMMMCLAVVGCGSEGGLTNTTTGSNGNTNTNGSYNGDSGTGNTQPDDDGKNVVDTEDYEDNDEDLIEFGTHIYTAPESQDKWFVKDGATQYKLVVPASTSEASTINFQYWNDK